jgi:hypothetical protein
VEAVAEHTGGCCMWCCTGTLPVEWADMEGMENIWLDGNKLSGEPPPPPHTHTYTV